MSAQSRWASTLWAGLRRRGMFTVDQAGSMRLTIQETSISNQATPPHGGSAMSFPAHEDLRRSRNVSPMRKLLGRRPDGTLLSTAHAGLQRMLPGATEGVRQDGVYFHRVCIFFVVFDVLDRACASILRDDRGPIWPWVKERGV